jgi:hypothetical protein
MPYWPQDPNGDMVPILKQSIEVAEALKAAKARHPSGKASGFPVVETFQGADMVTEPVADEAFPSYRSDGQRQRVTLTAADRCDNCGAAAVYRTQSGVTTTVLDFCLHHWRKHAPAMMQQGWTVIGANTELAAAVRGE